MHCPEQFNNWKYLSSGIEEVHNAILIEFQQGLYPTLGWSVQGARSKGAIKWGCKLGSSNSFTDYPFICDNMADTDLMEIEEK